MPRKSSAITLRNLLPPIIYKACRAFWAGARGQSAKVQEQGELDSDYYDEAFEKGQHWRKHYTQSPYYPNWLLIADRMKRASVHSVLDLGCGPGQFANLLADQGIVEYIGVDFSQKRIEQARKVCPQFKFIQANVFETDLVSTQIYDAVVCTELLEHVEQDVELLQIVRPGSRVYATVPNFSNQAHVRHFASESEVVDRYANLFQTYTIDRLLGNRPGKVFFLLEGVKQ